jgi:hypothetical protein
MATTIPSILRETYQKGQILQVADFETEQNFHIQHRNFQTRQLWSPGILVGLEVNTVDNTVVVATGAAIDENGQHILLAESKTLEVPGDGAYQLLISDAMTAVPGQPNQLRNDPNLRLAAAGETPGGGVSIADISVVNGLPTVKNAGLPAQIQPSRLPRQPITELDASVVRTGIFQASQIPELQKLSGRLTAEQLPFEPGSASEGLSFFAEKTVVLSGSNIRLFWASEPGVDNLSLEYFSESGIVNLQSSNGEIQLRQSDFTIVPSLTTTYTLTARTAGTIISQKQLTVTVVSLTFIAQMQFKGQKTAMECVEQIKNMFPTVNASELAEALASVGYPLSETASAIRNGFDVADSTEFGKIITRAFPLSSQLDIATLSKELYGNPGDVLKAIRGGFPLCSTTEAAKLLIHETLYPAMTYQEMWQVLKEIGFSDSETVLTLSEMFADQTRPIQATFFNSSIARTNTEVQLGSGTTYNDTYRYNWIMTLRGTSFIQVDFNHTKTGFSTVLLFLVHLTSMTNGSGGFSPIDILINGQTYKSGFDVGSGYMKLDTFDITSYVTEGNNTIRLNYCTQAITHYWIQDLKVEYIR